MRLEPVTTGSRPGHVPLHKSGWGGDEREVPFFRSLYRLATAAVSGDGHRRPGWRCPLGLDLGKVVEERGRIHGLHKMLVERRGGRHTFLAVAGDGHEDASRLLGIAAKRLGH